MALSLSKLLRHCRSLGLAALLFALSEAHVVRADEPRGDVPAEAKAKVEALLKEARELKEAGKHDEAKALMEKAESLARKLREAAGPAGEKRDQPRPTPELLERAENEIRQRRERAADLRAAGKVDEAEKLEVEAKSMAEKVRRVMAELREREGAPRDGDRRPDAPRDGGRRPDAPREGDRRPDAPREGERRPGAPREGDRRRAHHEKAHHEKAHHEKAHHEKAHHVVRVNRRVKVRPAKASRVRENAAMRRRLRVKAKSAAKRCGNCANR